MSEQAPVPGPRTVAEWYRDARHVLSQCEAEATRTGAPLEQDHLVQALQLARQLVARHGRPTRGGSSPR